MLKRFFSCLAILSLLTPNLASGMEDETGSHHTSRKNPPSTPDEEKWETQEKITMAGTALMSVVIIIATIYSSLRH